MTRQQLTDPFGSEDEDEMPTKAPSESPERRSNSSPKEESAEKIRRDSQVPSLLVIAGTVEEEQEVIKSNPNPRDSKTDDLKERARKLLEQTKREATASSSSSTKPLSKQGSQVILYKPHLLFAYLIIVSISLLVGRRRASAAVERASAQVDC